MGFFLSFFGGSAAVTSWRCFGDRAWWMWCFASAAASDSESAASLASIGAFFSFFVASATTISSEGGALWAWICVFASSKTTTTCLVRLFQALWRFVFIWSSNHNLWMNGALRFWCEFFFLFWINLLLTPTITILLLS